MPTMSRLMDKFQCSQCQRSFKRQEHLKRHQQGHDALKRFECDICHKSFTRSDVLSKHVSIHDHPTALAPLRRDTGRSRACLGCARAREKCSRTTPCRRCLVRSLICTYPEPQGKPMTAATPSQKDNACDTSQTSAIHPNDGMDLVSNVQAMPSNLQLSISPQDTSNSQPSPYIERSGNLAQPQTFEYDLAACNIDWDFPMNWLPYNNEIEANYYSILGLDTNLPSNAPINPSTADGSMTVTAQPDFPRINGDQRRLSSVTSFSPGSALGVSPQPSTGSDRTIPGDLYATSLNGARRPCTAKSKQLFPPADLQGYKQLPSISQHHTISSEGIFHLVFPELGHIIIESTEGYREPIMTESTYRQIYDAFTHTCIDSAIFRNHYTSTQFPSLMMLDYCIKLFFEHFNPIFPLIHPQLTDLNTSWVLALAISAVGSQYSATEEIDACVKPLHEFLRRVLVIQLENSELDVPLAQALVLSQVGLLYYGSADLRYTAYQRSGDLQKVINLYRRRSDSQSIEHTIDQTESDLHSEWRVWAEGESLRRLCYFIWLLDRMGSYFFDNRHTGTFDVGDISLPHDGLWAQVSASDWVATYRRVQGNPSLATAVNELFRERTTKEDLGEFSRILLLHAVYQEYSTVSTYCKRPLSSWMPHNSPEQQSDDSDSLRLSNSNWRNAALDCVDTLHWAANARIASLLGAEHPTVLHLHFSRVVLLVPRTAILTLVRYFQLPDRLRKWNLPTTSQQEALQAEREISEWAQQDASKARLAALHCGCFLWHVRRYAKVAFYEPPCVFWATLTLWAYSVYSSKTRPPGEMRSGSVTRQASPDITPLNNTALVDDQTPTFIRLDRPNDDEMVQLFVRAGVLKAYISGVGDIYASTAPPRILQEGRRILESVSLAWGRSREYLDLLQALG